MGIKTGIEWTDASVNFWQGCHKVSQGCANCYMFTDKKRYGQDPRVVARCGDATFYAALKWKEPKKIFTCSWSDFFIQEADEWRPDAWDVIRRTPQHTWQILTKRPERIADHLPPDWGNGWPHVWLGTSVEDQKAADERIPHLMSIPAKVRFLSCEPLLGPVDISQLLRHFNISLTGERDKETGGLKAVVSEAAPLIHWVIAGGESGPNARPMHPDWARSLRDQCAAAGVAFHFKQWGEWLPQLDNSDAYALANYVDKAAVPLIHPVRDDGFFTFPDGVVMNRVGKKNAGRLLDGRTWDEFPGVPQP